MLISIPKLDSFMYLIFFFNRKKIPQLNRIVTEVGTEPLKF